MTRLGPACGRILPDVDGGNCGREPGHPGDHVDGARGVALSMGRCAELSPEGKPCAIPSFGHLDGWGTEHSWERCTSRLVAGHAGTRCTLRPGHDGLSHHVKWDRLGEHDGLEL